MDLSWVAESRKSNTIWGFLRHLKLPRDLASEESDHSGHSTSDIHGDVTASNQVSVNDGSITNEECAQRFLGSSIAERVLENRNLENGGTLGAKKEGFNYCFCLGIFTEEELIEIEETKAHLAYEIHLSVVELDEAMVVAMVSVAFPF